MQFFKIDVGSEAGEAVILMMALAVLYSYRITRSYIDMVFFVTKLSD